MSEKWGSEELKNMKIKKMLKKWMSLTTPRPPCMSLPPTDVYSIGTITLGFYHEK